MRATKALPGRHRYADPTSEAARLFQRAQA
jgi:hypothetical protein